MTARRRPRKIARRTPNPAKGRRSVSPAAKREAMLARVVARGKRAILHDVKVGHVPRDVRDFSELHDYRDANMYTLNAKGDFDPDVERAFTVDLGDGEIDNTEMWEFYGESQDRLDAWVRSGVLRDVKLNPGALARLKREAEDRRYRNGQSPARKTANPKRTRRSKRTRNPGAGPSRMSFFEVYDAGGGGFEIVRAQSAQAVERKYRGASARRLRDSEIGEGDLNYFGPKGTRVTEAMRDEHRRATARLR